MLIEIAGQSKIGLFTLFEAVETTTYGLHTKMLVKLYTVVAKILFPFS